MPNSHTLHTSTRTHTHTHSYSYTHSHSLSEPQVIHGFILSSPPIHPRWPRLIGTFPAPVLSLHRFGSSLAFRLPSSPRRTVLSSDPSAKLVAHKAAFCHPNNHQLAARFRLSIDPFHPICTSSWASHQEQRQPRTANPLAIAFPVARSLGRRSTSAIAVRPSPSPLRTRTSSVALLCATTRPLLSARQPGWLHLGASNCQCSTNPQQDSSHPIA